MRFDQNYVAILIDSLHKKIVLLDEISEENEKQKLLLAKEGVELEELEPSLEKKQEYIDRLNELDEGFQSIYNRIKIELNEHSEQYKEEIKEMKELISKITGKSLIVQSEEERNKQIMEECFNKFKRGIRQAKTTKKAAANYYNNMNKLNHVEPQFMDRKK